MVGLGDEHSQFLPIGQPRPKFCPHDDCVDSLCKYTDLAHHLRTAHCAAQLQTELSIELHQTGWLTEVPYRVAGGVGRAAAVPRSLGVARFRGNRPGQRAAIGPPRLAEQHVARLRHARAQPAQAPPRPRGSIMLRTSSPRTSSEDNPEYEDAGEGGLVPPRICHVGAVVSHHLGSTMETKRRELQQQREHKQYFTVAQQAKEARNTRKRMAKVQPVVQNRLDSRLLAARQAAAITKTVRNENDDASRQTEFRMHNLRVTGARENGRLDRHDQMQARAHQIAQQCKLRAKAVVEAENGRQRYERRYDRFA